jgi:hypothetical protein
MTRLAEIVLKSSAIIRAYVMRAIRFESVLALVLILVLLGAITATAFITQRLRVTYQLERTVDRLGSELEHERRDLLATQKMLTDGQRELEMTVYGSLEPRMTKLGNVKPAPRVPLAALHSQIEELRVRVTQLERWRLQHLAREH